MKMASRPEIELDRSSGLHAAARFAFKAAAMLLAGVVMGALLLSLAYLLPLGPIRESAERSLPTLKEEGVHPQKLASSLNSVLDNFTDATMLDLASYDGEGGIAGALRSQRAYRSGAASDPIEALEASLEVTSSSSSDYTRYWHGYLVLLKPLMCIGLDYDGIRVLNAVGQTLLLLSLVAVLVIKRKAQLLPPLLVVLLCIEVFVVPFSLQYSSAFYLGFGSTLVVAWQPAFLRKRHHAILFFLAIGMLTSYIDFLTYPVFTLGIPAATYLYLNASRDDAKRSLAIVLSLVLAWFAGYGAMWAGKWLLASIVLHENIFADALASMSFRTSLQDGQSNAIGWGRLAKSLLIHYRESEILLPVIAALVGYGVLLAGKIVRYKKASVAVRELLAALCPYAIIFAVPMAWFVAVPNHTLIHNWMTYRGLSVCVYVLLVGFLHASGKGEERGHTIASITPL